METSKEIYKLVELSNNKYKLLQQIKEFTDRQTLLLKNNDMDGLNGMIAAKQKRIDAINILDMEFDSGFNDIKKNLGISSFEELNRKDIYGAKELFEVVKRIISLVNIIQTVEESNQKHVQENLEDLSSKIKGVNKGKKATSAYYPKPYRIPSYYIDKKK